jgi:hypothetical protein
MDGTRYRFVISVIFVNLNGSERRTIGQDNPLGAPLAFDTVNSAGEIVTNRYIVRGRTFNTTVLRLRKASSTCLRATTDAA